MASVNVQNPSTLLEEEGMARAGDGVVADACDGGDDDENEGLGSGRRRDSEVVRRVNVARNCSGRSDDGGGFASAGVTGRELAAEVVFEFEVFCRCCCPCCC